MAPLKELNGHDLDLQGGGIFFNCKGGNSENLGSSRDYELRCRIICRILSLMARVAEPFGHT